MLRVFEPASQLFAPPGELGDDVLRVLVGDGELAEPSVNLCEACRLLLRAHEGEMAVGIVGNGGGRFVDSPQTFEYLLDGVLGVEVFLTRLREVALHLGEGL